MNMKPLKTIEVEQYEYGNYIIETIDTGDMLEAWIQKKDYAIKSLMFGLPYRQPDKTYTKQECLEVVEANLPEQITLYAEAFEE